MLTPYQPPGSQALARASGLLLGNRIPSQPAVVAPQSELAERAPRSAGLEVEPSGGMYVSSDVGRLLDIKPKSGDFDGGLQGEEVVSLHEFFHPVEISSLHDDGARLGAALGASSVPCTPPTVQGSAVVPLPEHAQFHGKSVRKLLQELSECAADIGEDDCIGLSASGALAYPARMRLMAAALKADPARACDLASFETAYHALRNTFYRMRFLMLQIASELPEVQSEMPRWARGLCNRAIDRAMTTPDVAVSAEVNKALALHVQTLREMRNTTLNDARQHIDAVFRDIYKPGNREVDGASQDANDANTRFQLSGAISINTPEKRLLEIIQTLPPGQIVPAQPSFLNTIGIGNPPHGLYTAVYPNFRKIQWAPPGGHPIRPILVAADRATGQSYSLDEGRSWHSSGAPSDDALDAERARRWARLVAIRRNDFDDLNWRQNKGHSPANTQP